MHETSTAVAITDALQIHLVYLFICILKFAMSEISKWKKFANEIKRKQTNVATKQKNTKSGQTSKNAGNAGGSSILENKEITAQPLATEAAGKAKKYERTGPQEFVPFVFDEVTIPNIITACNSHFKK